MIDDIVRMYGYRHSQWDHMRDAITNFERGNETYMWELLLVSAFYKIEANEIFDSLTDEDLATLMCNHGMKLVVSCTNEY